MWILPSRRNFPEFQMGLRLMWLVISSAHNLITVIQTVRRKLHTTLNNICTVLTSTRIEPELSESLNIQFVMSTFPLYQRGSPLDNNTSYIFYFKNSILTFLSSIKLEGHLYILKETQANTLCAFIFHP